MGRDVNKKKMRFSVFVIHAVAEKLGTIPAEVYERLLADRILDEYIFACYDTLHTQGKEAIVEDIVSFMQERENG